MPNDTAVIYKISSMYSDNAYVGSTIEPKRRWRLHKKELNQGTHTSFVLQRAWDKYGEDAFTFEAVLICSVKERFFYEVTVINTFGSYNLLKGAGQPPAGAMQGLKHSATGIQNLSTGATKRWATSRVEKYDPLCKKAWALVENGLPKYKACKEVGISHSTFWNWIGKNNLKEWWNI